MTDLESRLADLEGRLARLEDEREVTRVITAYGPLVDSGDAARVGDLWAPDGRYDVDERLMVGRDEVVAMVDGQRHQGFIGDGCAHFLGPAHVTVDGDRAIAVGYSLMVVSDDGGFRVRRATANHWRLHRSDGRWRVVDRTARVLDGRAEARDLLRAGVTDAAGTGDASASATAGSADAVLDRLHRLQRAIDARDWDTIRETFTPDGTGYGRTGIEDIVEIMKAHLGGCGPTQHLLGNSLVSVTGERARVRSYARVHHQGAGPMQGESYEALGEYDDRWRLVDGSWRLEHRAFDTRIHLGDFAVLRPADG